MAAAEVGDDVFEGDPTVKKLERRVAELFGKEAALFVPSGTMGNLVSLASVTQPGDEILVERECHIVNYEVASVAAICGLQTNMVTGDGGVLTADQVATHIKTADLHTPGTRAVALENTHNRAGGRVYPLAEMQAIARLARERGVWVHLDGARVANAAVASGVDFADYGKCVDSISFCFSKGLGAPVGSAVVGTTEMIGRARRMRKRFGGGMRQVGVLAAAALYALDHNVARLEDDHNRARRLGEAFSRVPGVGLAAPVETNIVVLTLDPSAHRVDDFLSQLEQHQISGVAFGANRVRFVTHLHISDEDIARVESVVANLAG